MYHAKAFFHLIRAMVCTPQQRLKPDLQRFDVLAEQPRVNFLQEFLDQEQGMSFGCVEPHARQSESRTILIFGFVTIAAGIPVPEYRRIQSVAEIFQVSLESGRRNIELFQKFINRYYTASCQHLVNLVKTFAAIHASPRNISCIVAHLVS